MIETRTSCFDFHTHPDVVVIRMMPLKKRWRRDEKTGKSIRLKDFRTFPIRRDEPLTQHVEEWVSGCSIDPPFGVSRNKARALPEDYGFDVFSINQFFGWKPKRTSMAEKYASMGWKGLARAMGVEV